MEELLLEAEKTLYFVECAVPLARTADFDKYCAEIDCILETVEQMASKTRELISNEIIRIHIAEKKEAEV